MLIHTLNSLASSVSQHVTNLNYGGCCVFAAEVAKVLRAKGYKVQGVVASELYGNGSDLDSVRNNLRNPKDQREWNKNGIQFGHVGLRIDYDSAAYHYDSKGLSSRLDRVGSVGGVYDGHLTVEEMEALAADASGWNPTFNRKQIPKLKQLVAAHLENL